jgi:ATP-binding protein involved in chromosome partitioning
VRTAPLLFALSVVLALGCGGGDGGGLDTTPLTSSSFSPSTATTPDGRSAPLLWWRYQVNGGEPVSANFEGASISVPFDDVLLTVDTRSRRRSASTSGPISGRVEGFDISGAYTVASEQVRAVYFVMRFERLGLSDEDRENLRKMLHGDAGASAGEGQAHGHAEGRAVPFAKNDSKTRPLLISSGKGGVGKSTVTTNLAVALAAQGYSVGIIDADIYGYSIPRMLGTDRDPVVIDEMLIPPEMYGVRAISIGYFVPQGEAIIWRGPMLHKALEQFLTDVFWDEPDFLLIDMPPGTGDIALSLSQYLPRGEVFVVTTPQPAAQKVAAMSAAMAEKVNLPVRGIIENMSWFTGDDGKQYEIFGSGGGQALADEVGVPLLGKLPLVPELREGGDDGKPITAVDPESESAKIFHEMARQIAVDMKPKKIYSPELKIL